MAISITITVFCSMCGKQLTAKGHAEFSADVDDDMLESVKSIVRAAKGIYQHNGDNHDTYCSKKCAE